MTSDRFEGHILGVGTSSGHRLVVGHWPSSPLGSFADVMWAAPDGTRRLLAPDQRVADYVSATYRFEEVRIVPVEVVLGDDSLTADAGDLHLQARLGARTGLGRILRLVPRPVARTPAFTLLTDPVARVVMPGVRTRGSAGSGRQEFYAAHDVRRVTEVTATLAGQDLGPLTPVDPPPDFGFSSTPRTPSLTTVTTTVRR